MKKKLILLFTTVLVMGAITSCEEFLDINKDPNLPGDAPVDLVLPTAITSSASVVGGDYAILGGIWSQYYTQNNGSNQYKHIDSFNLQTENFNNSFSELYAGALSDFEYIRTESLRQQNWSYFLISTVMQAYTFQVLVDLYDQIPFSEALMGDANRTPHYDDGDVVYDELIARIDDALSKDFDQTVAGVRTSKYPGPGDFIFGREAEAGEDLDGLVDANVDDWKRFANTLKLKIFLRQINTRPQVAAAGLNSLFNEGAVFLSENAAMTQFINAASKSNPMFEMDQRQLNTTNNLKASRTLFSFLVENGDSRLQKLYIPGSGGQRALDQGNFDVSSTVVVPASISGALINATDPVYFFSAAECYFLRAEAAVRGFGNDNAASLFNLGVQSSFAQLNATPILYDFDLGWTSEEKLEAIMVQKWVALAGTHQGIEAFFERNRTNFPRTSVDDQGNPVYSGLANGSQNPDYIPGEFVYPKSGVTAGLFAKRLLFPDTERRRNPNTPPQKNVVEEVWWDVVE